MEKGKDWRRTVFCSTLGLVTVLTLPGMWLVGSVVEDPSSVLKPHLSQPRAASAEVESLVYPGDDGGGELVLRFSLPDPQSVAEAGVALHPEAKAAGSAALVNAFVIAVAFVLVAVTACALAVNAAWSVAGTRSKGWIAAGAVGGALGLALVERDPIGPLVSLDFSVLSPDPQLRFLGAANPALDPASGYLWIGLLVTGILAGATIALVLWFLYRVLLAETREKTTDHLRKRKRLLSLVVSVASVALSLGVALISLFLGWGGSYLTESSQKIASVIAGAGTAYWGGMITLLTLTATAVTAYYLHEDINRAKTGDQSLSAWKKEEDLDFDPLKTVATVVAALSPVLTSTLIVALGGSFA